MHAVAESARNVACTGATPVAATNCLNFGNPQKPEIMWQFAQAIDGMTKACEELEVPITGGNVSFYNETLDEAIYPTPVLGVVGILEDVNQAARMHFREPGRSVMLLRGSGPGERRDGEAEFGSSEYTREVLGAIWGFPRALELDQEAALQKCLVAWVQAGLVDSAHDISEGGLAVTVAESGFRNLVGARLELASNGLPVECVLFGEDASRVVISCDRDNLQRIKQIARKYGISAEVLGETIPDRMEIMVDGKPLVSAGISDLGNTWGQALERALHTETGERLVPAVIQKS